MASFKHNYSLEEEKGFCDIHEKGEKMEVLAAVLVGSPALPGPGKPRTSHWKCWEQLSKLGACWKTDSCCADGGRTVKYAFVLIELYITLWWSKKKIYKITLLCS